MKVLKTILPFLLLIFNSCRQKTLKSNPNQIAVQLNSQAMTLVAHLENSDSSMKAISLLDKATSIDSNYFVGYLNKLIFLLQMKQYDKAIVTNNKLIELRPLSHDLYLRSGMLYELIGDTISASQHFNKSLKIINVVLDTMNKNNKDFVMLTTNQAINLIMLEDSTKANMILKELYNAQPNDIEFGKVEKKYIQSLINKSKQELLYYLYNSDKKVF